MDEDQIARIEAIIDGPAAASADGQSVTNQDPEKAAKAYQRINGEAAAALKHRGLRFTKLVPPGTV